MLSDHDVNAIVAVLIFSTVCLCLVILATGVAIRCARKRP